MRNDYPILVFPQPTQEVDRTPLPHGAGRIRRPSAADTASRVMPKFTDLVNAIDARRIAIQQNVRGVDPEEVLVLETAGRVEDFYNVVQKINGLEWLLDEDFEADPDDEYYEINNQGERKPGKLSSRLYLVSTNSRAISELLSYYNRYVNAPEERFPEGYAKLKDVFAHLRDVRYWDSQDRLPDSDVVNNWLDNNDSLPGQIKLVIELWFREDSAKRSEVQMNVENLVSTSGGRVLSTCVIEEIRYHALLVEISRVNLRYVFENIEEGSLIKCQEIKYFKPLPQAISSIGDVDDTAPFDGSPDQNLPTGAPIVALLDGYPLKGHQLLDGRMIIEDPDGFERLYEVNCRRHGTEMASLIIHGDLSRHEEAISRPLYVRPIMVPYDNRHAIEGMPEEILPVDLIHRAVKRIFEGDDGMHPDAPSVRIINFSIGDSTQMFDREMSPLARLLDWLSYKYGVLFIISAGNDNRFQLNMGCSFQEFKQKPQHEISKLVSRELFERYSARRIISPAESINNITVGSVHNDFEQVPPNDGLRLNPYTLFHPTVYSPFGGGMNGSIKPDLVYDGGRQFLQEHLTERDLLVQSSYKRAPGIKVAFPSDDLTRTISERGTSHSTALISRYAFFCHEMLQRLLEDNGMPDTHIHLLIKALLVHGCTWGELRNSIRETMPRARSVRDENDLIRRWIGYGYPEFEKSLTCDPQRATVVGFGELNDGQAHVFKFPLPSVLAGKRVKRRLTVTLAWMSPIAPQNHRYRKARLWFELGDNSGIADDRVDITQYQTVRKGTLQHEVFEDERRFLFGENETLNIKVNCANDIGGDEVPIKYAIAVTLEMVEGEQIDLFEESIYAAVREKLRVAVPIPALND